MERTEGSVHAGSPEWVRDRWTNLLSETLGYNGVGKSQDTLPPYIGRPLRRLPKSIYLKYFLKSTYFKKGSATTLVKYMISIGTDSPFQNGKYGVRTSDLL